MKKLIFLIPIYLFSCNANYQTMNMQDYCDNLVIVATLIIPMPTIKGGKNLKVINNTLKSEKLATVTLKELVLVENTSKYGFAHIFIQHSPDYYVRAHKMPKPNKNLFVNG